MKHAPGIKPIALLLAIILAMLPACNLATTPVATVKRIAFYSFEPSQNDGKEHDIYLVNADGSGLTRLTNDGTSSGPAWSPDGERLAFISWCNNSDRGIRLVKADGSDSRCLEIGSIGLPLAWSPDGQQIAFASTASDKDVLYILNLKASGLQGKPGSPPQLLNWRGFDVITSIVWSPDGQQIAYSYRENPDAPNEIAVINVEQALQSANGMDGTTLSKGDNPAWSPDGQKIAFVSYQDDNPGISIMGANGNHPTRLANASYYPAWSPDGQKIAFMSNRDGNWEIYIMDADGTHQTRLTNNSAFDSYPAWSPDGQQVAFVSGEDNLNGKIYVMNADGSHSMRLAEIPVWLQVPMWAPQ